MADSVRSRGGKVEEGVTVTGLQTTGPQPRVETSAGPYGERPAVLAPFDPLRWPAGVSNPRAALDHEGPTLVHGRRWAPRG